jgi:hypothetical protein
MKDKLSQLHPYNPGRKKKKRGVLEERRGDNKRRNIPG